MWPKLKKSFTLVEVLFVISIISLLAVLILAAVNSAREKAKIAKSKAEMRQIINAMQLFFDDFGEFPPIGDAYSAMCPPCADLGFAWCSELYNQPKNQWNRTMNALVPAYFSQRIDKDPWGTPYCYDDNGPNACGGNDCGKDEETWIYSIGPDGQSQTTWGAIGVGFGVTSMGGDDFGYVIQVED